MEPVNMPRTKANVPADESKADKFKRLATSRTEKALSAIANIGGLANTASYEYTPEQVQKILKALDDEMNTLKRRFEKPEAKAEAGFSLD